MLYLGPLPTLSAALPGTQFWTGRAELTSYFTNLNSLPSHNVLTQCSSASEKAK